MKRSAPSALRNRAPILEVLRRVLPAEGVVLELASGTGEHAVHFAAALPGLTWQPSDPSPEARASIAAWRAEAALPNLRPPLPLDVVAPWPLDDVAPLAAIVCINMIHIAPWAATEALFAGAARALAPGAPLVTYGPYRFGGAFTADSNAAFDADLRAPRSALGRARRRRPRGRRRRRGPRGDRHVRPAREQPRHRVAPRLARHGIPAPRNRCRKPWAPAPPIELQIGDAGPAGQSTSRSYDQ
jgi:SAM-dependent methyltransferase